jgi:protein-S-isoprenylcysteine O-methyltransferase Ste14
MSAPVAVNILWAGWYATWIAAGVFSNRTATQMRTDMFGLHRYLASIGSLMLFVPAGVGEPWLNSALLGWLTQRLWREPGWIAWALLGGVATAFGFCWWARLHLGRLWSGLVTLKEGHRIIDTGPYALVRHPIYFGVMVAALLTALIRASGPALAGFALISLGFSITARIEEGFLREQLGPDAYDDYSRRVPMLLPGIG